MGRLWVVEALLVFKSRCVDGYSWSDLQRRGQIIGQRKPKSSQAAEAAGSNSIKSRIPEAF